MKIDWVKKLTSRKFWVAVAGFVSSLLTACNVGDGTVAQIVAIIMAGACVVAYILGEGLADMGNKSNTEAGDNQQEETDG